MSIPFGLESKRVYPYGCLWKHCFDPGGYRYRLVEVDYENNRGLFNDLERPERLPRWYSFDEMKGKM